MEPRSRFGAVPGRVLLLGIGLVVLVVVLLLSWPEGDSSDSGVIRSQPASGAAEDEREGPDPIASDESGVFEAAKAELVRVARLRSALDPLERVGTDSAWDGYPRTERRLLGLIYTPPLLDAKKLYRSVELNPEDVYIEPSVRETLPGLIAPLIAELQAVDVKATNAVLVEGPAAIDAGLATPAEIEETPEPVRRAIERLTGPRFSGRMQIISMREGMVGQLGVHLHRKGQLWWVPDQAMPSRVAQGVYRRKALTRLGAIITTWFVYAGTLPGSEAERIAMEIAKRFMTGG